jgi:hypothetical protein
MLLQLPVRLAVRGRDGARSAIVIVARGTRNGCIRQRPQPLLRIWQWSRAGSKWITRNSQVASIQRLLSQWRAAFPTHLSGGYHRKAKPALARHQHAKKSVSRWHTDLLLHARTNGIAADEDSFSETEEPKSAFSQAHHLQSHATMEDIIASKNSIWWDGQVWRELSRWCSTHVCTQEWMVLPPVKILP